MAKAGFSPGMVLDLTLWFPRTCRAGVNAALVGGVKDAALSFAGGLYLVAAVTALAGQ